MAKRHGTAVKHTTVRDMKQQHWQSDNERIAFKDAIIGTEEVVFEN